MERPILKTEFFLFLLHHGLILYHPQILKFPQLPLIKTPSSIKHYNLFNKVKLF